MGEHDKMVAAATGSEILLWALQAEGGGSEIGVFHLGVPVEALFFVGNQLIATSHTGRIGVWNAVTKHWQVRALARRSVSSPVSREGFISTPLNRERAREPSTGPGPGAGRGGKDLRGIREAFLEEALPSRCKGGWLRKGSKDSADTGGGSW